MNSYLGRELCEDLKQYKENNFSYGNNLISIILIIILILPLSVFTFKFLRQLMQINSETEWCYLNDSDQKILLG